MANQKKSLPILTFDNKSSFLITVLLYLLSLFFSTYITNNLYNYIAISSALCSSTKCSSLDVCIRLKYIKTAHYGYWKNEILD